MKVLPWLVAGITLVVWMVGRAGTPSAPPNPPEKKDDPVVLLHPKADFARVRKEESAASDLPYLEVTGRTQCVPARKALIAPVPLHPVVAVLVVSGQRVKKDQPLIKIDDDEAQVDVRAKTATLESARHTLKEWQRLLPRMKDLWLSGAGTEVGYYTTRRDALKAEQDERAAAAALDSAKAELEHFVVTAQVDGVVSWLDVHVGMVSRPGRTVWGEILDLREIDVRCDVTLDQADCITVGQAVVARRMGKNHAFRGKVVFIGVAADKTSGLVPVTVRLPDAKGSLRCEAPMAVRFPKGDAVNGPTP